MKTCYNYSKFVFYTIIFLCFTSLNVYSQATVTPNIFGVGAYLGWSSSNDLDFNIAGTNMMRLNSIGLFGIGGVSIPPAFQLDVANDINLNPGIFPNTGYRWNDEVILKTNSTTENIFLGFSAGNLSGGTANTFLGAYSGMLKTNNGGGNTFAGWSAGRAGPDVAESVFIGSRAGEFNNGTVNCFVGVLAGNGIALNNSSGNSFFGSSAGRINTGNNNTFIGNASGVNNTQDLNTFVGNNSGNANTTGDHNAFLGGNSGLLNTSGRNLTFLGYEAGLNNISGTSNTFTGTSSGHDNTTGGELTFYGFESGFSNTTGINNTFGGSSSGRSNTDGNDNAFFGFRSGFSNDRGNENVFLGSRSGNLNVDGSHNTFTGFEAGMSNDLDHENSYYGYVSGRVLSSGTLNTFVGSQSGSTINTGSTLTLIGANTASNNNLTNSSALGANSVVNNSDNMILGDNTVNVGIGFSGAPVGNGPATKLEINTDPVNFNYSGLDQSGLRFTQLVSTSTASPGITRFLTVNNNGDVILGDIPGGGGPVSACPSPGLVATNYLTKITALNEICKTEGIYESSTAPIFSVGIGVGSTPNPAFKLHMKGDLLIERAGGTTEGNIYMQNGSGVKRVFSIYGLGGYRSLAIGPNAGPAVLSTSGANRCVYIGGESGINTVSNSNNTFVGDQSGFSMGSTGNSNTFLGTYAAFSMFQGDENVVLGHNAASQVFQQGIGNTILGSQSTNFGMTRGDYNVIIGHVASVGDQFGSNNIIIGTRALGTNGTATLTNAGTIGANGRVKCSDCFTIGAQVGMEQQIGIGFVSPATTVIPAPAPPLTAAKLYVSSFAGGTTAAYFAGTVYAPLFTVASDSSLKQNI